MSDRPFRVVLFGGAVAHSRSGEIFCALAHVGGPAVEHEAIVSTPERLAADLDRLRQGEWDAAHVTVPLKVVAAGLADDLDLSARKSGVVNTLVRGADGRLTGFETDGAGFVRGLDAFPEEVRPGPGAPVVILGAGGAARAVANALSWTGSPVVVVSRDPQRAEWIDKSGFKGVGWTDRRLAEEVARADLIVQATPVGMAPDVERQPPLPAALITAGRRVVDLIYNPWQTRFLEQARRRGAAAINGWPMLVHQAALALTLWRDASAGALLLEAGRLVETRDPGRP